MVVCPGLSESGSGFVCRDRIASVGLVTADQHPGCGTDEDSNNQGKIQVDRTASLKSIAGILLQYALGCAQARSR